MDFKVVQKEVELQSRGWIPTFHDISKEIMEIVAASGIKNGTCAVVSHHTTCSVMVQECSHDLDTFDLEYLQHDLLDIMRKFAVREQELATIKLNYRNKYGTMRPTTDPDTGEKVSISEALRRFINDRPLFTPDYVKQMTGGM